MDRTDGTEMMFVYLWFQGCENVIKLFFGGEDNETVFLGIGDRGFGALVC